MGKSTLLAHTYRPKYLTLQSKHLKSGELARLLANRSKSFADISRRLGISRQRVHQLYIKYRYCLPGPSARARQRIRSLRGLRARFLRYLRSKPHLRNLYRLLKTHGIAVRPIPALPPQYFHKKSILVNNKPCLVSVTSSPRSYYSTKRQYSRFLSSPSRLRRYKFIILCQILADETRYFVFPTRILLDTIKGKSISLYPPVERNLPIHKNMKPALNYWEYENAFQLIIEETKG